MWSTHISKESAPCIQGIGIGLFAITAAEILALNSIFVSVLALFLHEVMIIGYENIVANTILYVFLCHVISFVFGQIVISYYPTHTLLYFSISITLIVISGILVIIYKNNRIKSRRKDLLTECSSIIIQNISPSPPSTPTHHNTTPTHHNTTPTHHNTTPLDIATSITPNISQPKHQSHSLKQHTKNIIKRNIHHTENVHIRERTHPQHQQQKQHNVDLSSFL